MHGLLVAALCGAFAAAAPRVRPYYHLTADHGGINDPNGLFYYKGSISVDSGAGVNVRISG